MESVIERLTNYHAAPKIKNGIEYVVEPPPAPEPAPEPRSDELIRSIERARLLMSINIG